MDASKPYQKLTVPLEIKEITGREFSGYASTFGNVDFGGDIVMPGAFTNSLENYAQEGTLPPMFWMHQMDQVPGKWTSMKEDNNGLHVTGVLAKTDLGDEIYTLLKMKAVSGMSIGYIPTDVNYMANGVRQLKELDLIENSIVSLPMNPQATISMVKTRLSATGEYVPTAGEIAEMKRDVEDFLQFKGWSRRAAIAGVSNFFKEFTDARSEGSQQPAVATPDEIELAAGVSDFAERMLLIDLNKRLKETFHG